MKTQTLTLALRSKLPNNCSAYRVGTVNTDMHPTAHTAERVWTVWHRAHFAGLVTVHHYTDLPEAHHVAEHCWSYIPQPGYGSYIEPTRRDRLLVSLSTMLLAVETQFVLLNSLTSREV